MVAEADSIGQRMPFHRPRRIDYLAYPIAARSNNDKPATRMAADFGGGRRCGPGGLGWYRGSVHGMLTQPARGFRWVALTMGLRTWQNLPGDLVRRCIESAVGHLAWHGHGHGLKTPAVALKPIR